ncbi:MAG: hypothetical protein ACJ0RJ_02670 [Alphaproteobacteria bacterium]|tara:strand:+ start:694 stop:1353 length:660 start_codon:yes stop_codon:yes gene_type:complete
MNDSKLNFIQSFQYFVRNNFRRIIILIGSLMLLLIFIQIYLYYDDRNLKKTSIKFFNILENDDKFITDMNDLSDDKNIYSILSQLKLIQINNKNKNYYLSNEIYKKLIESKHLNSIYVSAIATNASYTLINASYIENTNRYLDDISKYISYINDELESYKSIKKELEYLNIITEIDINNLDYKNNNLALELYDTISNSSLISSSIKERVKKIHEFQIYK